MVPNSTFDTHGLGHRCYDGIAVQEDYPVEQGWMALRLELWHAVAHLPAAERERISAMISRAGWYL